VATEKHVRLEAGYVVLTISSVIPADDVAEKQVTGFSFRQGRSVQLF
jgi:hypothetical protein